MIQKRAVFVVLTLMCLLSGRAQQNVLVPSFPRAPEKSLTQQTTIVQTDSALIIKADSTFFKVKAFKPNPRRAVLMSAIFPGLGQIYNRKYWKLPILYGGFVGLAYAISWNNKYYRDYYNGYIDIMDNDPNTNRWHKFVPYGREPASVEAHFKSGVLQRGKDFYRRNRDLSIIAAVALYGLNIVDAYVDAQLFDFDISPDLSMRLQPSISVDAQPFAANMLGMQCTFRF